jgi:hypothetical protein
MKVSKHFLNLKFEQCCLGKSALAFVKELIYWQNRAFYERFWVFEVSITVIFEKSKVWATRIMMEQDFEALFL